MGAGAGAGVVALVGSEDGTVALWPTWRASRPLHVLLAHTDAVVAVRTAMDAPQDTSNRSGSGLGSGGGSTAAGRNVGCYGGRGSGGKACAESIEGTDQERLGKANGDGGGGGCSPFFVVTAGVNREVKVWGARTAAGTKGAPPPPLSLTGYTIVGAGSGGGSDRLTALELLSEAFMACGFQSGAVEVWSIPFSSRGGGGVLATTREAAHTFPRAHGAKVTSIAVSFGLRFRAERGGPEAAGRVVLTTSADHTVVRWVAMPPGSSMRPMNRYCLSTEPTAAFLLPPYALSPGQTFALMRRRTKMPRTDLKTAGAAAEIFRVVAALDGMITVLELATATTLMLGAGEARSQPLALANALPGTPLVAKLPRQHPFTSGSEQGDPIDQFWRVGGPRGREAGRYNVLGGTETLPLGDWVASGGKRLGRSVALRNAWHTAEAGSCADGERDALGMRHWSKKQRGGLVRESDQQPSFSARQSLLPPQPKRKGKKRRGGGSMTRKSLARRSATMKPSVKTLTISRKNAFGVISSSNPDVQGLDGSQAWGVMSSGDASRQVPGGKTIKLDPRFAAVFWERMMTEKLSGGGGNGGGAHVLPLSTSARTEQAGQERDVHSIELPMLTYTTSLSCNSDAVAEQTSSTRRPSNAEKREKEEVSTVASPAQETTDRRLWLLEDGSLPPAGPPALGSPPSPESSVVHASEMLTLSERDQDSPPRTTTAFGHIVSVNSASGGGVISVETRASSSSAASARAVTLKNRGEGRVECTPEGRLNKPNQSGAEEEGDEAEARSFASDGTAAAGWGQEAAVVVGEKKKAKILGGMNPVVAAAKMARDARHAQDLHGRLISPMVVERLQAGREPRQQFNFDSTQAPSSGMLGAGMAVPKGFADARCHDCVGGWGGCVQCLNLK